MNEDLRSHAVAKRTAEQQAERVMRFQKMMDVMQEVTVVRHEQNGRWENQPHLADRPVEVWLDAIETQTNIVGDEADTRYQLITIAALAVAAVEAMDRKQEQNVKEMIDGHTGGVDES